MIYKEGQAPEQGSDVQNKCKNCKHFCRVIETAKFGICNALKIKEVFEESDIDYQDADIVDYTTFEDSSCSYSYVSENFGCIRFIDGTVDLFQKI